MFNQVKRAPINLISARLDVFQLLLAFFSQLLLAGFSKPTFTASLIRLGMLTWQLLVIPIKMLVGTVIAAAVGQ